ncbi:MAG: carboxypeptidase-like regulatory domain-containing protein, partial [Planctomycetota bacterium]
EDCKAVVTVNAEAQVTAVLRQGLTLSGRVEAPEKGLYPKTVVGLLLSVYRTTGVTSEGRFTFTGLVPGRYSLQAWAPGLMIAEQVQGVLRLDTASPEPSLKLVRPGGAALSVERCFAGSSAMLTPRGARDPLSPRRPEPWQQPLWFPVALDASGRAEIWGVTPGEYDVLLTPGRETRTIYANPFYQGSAPAEGQMQLIAGPVEVRALKSVAELHTLPAVALKIESGSATVKGRVVFPKAAGPGAGAGRSYGNLTLELVGRAATGSVYLGYQNRLTGSSQHKPIIIGTPPPGVQLEVAEPGAFVFHGVPPGEYKVWAEVTRYPHPYWRKDEDTPKLPPVLLATVVVPADGRVDLGALKFELPAAASSPEEAADESPQFGWGWHGGDPPLARWQEEAEPEDQVQLFQP